MYSNVATAEGLYSRLNTKKLANMTARAVYKSGTDGKIF